MTNVLNLMPLIEASRNRQFEPSPAGRIFECFEKISNANAQLLASAAALGFAGVAEMNDYWRKLAALAVTGLSDA